MAQPPVPVRIGQLPYYDTMPQGGVLLVSVPDPRDASKRVFATALPNFAVLAPSGGDTSVGGGTTGGDTTTGGSVVTPTQSNKILLRDGSSLILRDGSYLNHRDTNSDTIIYPVGDPMAESAQNTQLTSTTGKITDANGNTYALVASSAGLGVAFNNTYVSPTKNITLGLYYNHTFYMRDSSANWFQWTSLPYTASSDPRPATVAAETLAVATPAAQTAGMAFTLHGTYTNGPPSALDYSLNGGSTWTPANSLTVGSGAFSFPVTISAANSAQAISVRDHGTQTISATSGNFVVNAASVPAETLTVTTPAAQTAGNAFVLRGTYTNELPTALDYSLDAGSTWTVAASPTIASGAYSFSVMISAANSAQTIKVRDHTTQTITATSGSFAVAAAATTTSGSTTTTVSPKSTLVLTAGQTITDAAKNTYTFNSSGFVVTNGTPEDGLNGHATTANVNAIYFDGTNLWQRNTAGNWYTRTSPTAAYIGPTPLPVSAPGFTVTTPGVAIVDGAGNLMTMSSTGYVVTNGVTEDGTNSTPPTANVVEEYWDGTNFWQKNNAGNWYYRPNPATAYAGPANDPTAAAPATASSRYQVKNGRFYDPAGNVFTPKGVNVTPYTGYAPSTYASVKAFFPGINFIRLVTAYNWTQGGQDKATVYAFIQDANADGVVVLLDQHTLGTVHTGTDLTAVCNWFAGVATDNLNNPLLWYDTSNEPNGDFGSIAAEELAIYNAIRNTGNKNPILMQLQGGSYTDWRAGLASTWSGMTNVAWDMHFYGFWEPYYGSGATRATNDSGTISNLAQAVSTVQTFTSADGTMPVLIGEVGLSTSGVKNTVDSNASSTLVAVFGSTGISGWTGWALNGTDRPGGDSMSDDDATLTTWGQQAAAQIKTAVKGKNASATPPSTNGVATSLPAPTGSSSNTFAQATGSDVQVYLTKPQGWNVPASLYGISCGHMSVTSDQKYSGLNVAAIRTAIGNLKFGMIRLNWDRQTTMSYAFDSGTFDSSSVDAFINNASLFNIGPVPLIITIGWSSAVGNALAAGNASSVTATHQSQCNQMAAYFKSKGLTGIYWELVNEPDPYDGNDGSTSDMSVLATMFNAMRAGIKAADSTAKCGGVTSSYRRDDHIAAWYNLCSPKPDFITWHSYLSSGTSEADVVTLNKVLGANTNFASLRSSLGSFTGPFGNTERNWNGTPSDNEVRNQNVIGAVLMAADQMTQIQGDHNAVFSGIWDIGPGDSTYGLIDYNDYHIYPTGLLLTRLATTMPGEALGMAIAPSLVNATVNNGASTGSGRLLGQSTILNGKVAVQLINIGDGALSANLVLNGFTGSSVTKAEHSAANPNGATSTLATTGTGVSVTIPAKSVVVFSG